MDRNGRKKNEKQFAVTFFIYEYGQVRIRYKYFGVSFVLAALDGTPIYVIKLSTCMCRRYICHFVMTVVNAFSNTAISEFPITNLTS